VWPDPGRTLVEGPFVAPAVSGVAADPSTCPVGHFLCHYHGHITGAVDDRSLTSGHTIDEEADHGRT